MRSDPDHRNLRIATFAVPLSGNKGSASMLLGLLDGLHAEGFTVEAVVYSYYPKRDAEVARDLPNVVVRAGHPKHLLTLIPALLAARLFGAALPDRMKRKYAELRSCDVVCCMGGTTFADSQLFKVPWNAAAALPGFIAGRPVAFLSQTMGPFTDWRNRLAAKWTLSRAAAVHGRGQRSTGYVRALGCPHARYWPDLSFQMNFEQAEASARLRPWLDKISHDERGRPRVGITPNTIVDEKTKAAGIDYANLMAAVIIDLAKRDHRLILIPHSYREGEAAAHNNDAHLCRRILELLPLDVDCLYIEEDLSSQELRILIQQMDFLVASRFHSMVSALAVGIPPITIGWGDQKYIEVLEEFGVSELYIDYPDASLDAVREKVRFLNKDRREIAARMKAGIERADGTGRCLGLELMALKDNGYT